MEGGGRGVMEGGGRGVMEGGVAMEGGEKMEGGREEWCGMMEGQGPKELTHLGSLSPMSTHGRWTTFVSGCLHGCLF